MIINQNGANEVTGAKIEEPDEILINTPALVFQTFVDQNYIEFLPVAGVLREMDKVQNTNITTTRVSLEVIIFAVNLKKLALKQPILQKAGPLQTSGQLFLTTVIDSSSL